MARIKANRTRSNSPLNAARNHVAVVLTALLFAQVAHVHAQPILQVQINGQKVGGQMANDNLILPVPPREIRRILSAAEKAIDAEEYSDAVEALTEILDAPDSEDFFLPAQDIRGIRTSLKKRALDLLGEMPAAGREMYELEVGSEARRRLKEAIAAGDIAGVREVSRRFFHTKTGYQATMLLARSELDQGRPLAAVLNLQRLMQSSSAVDAFDHELPFLLAACWQIAGEKKAAEKVIKENLNSLAGAKVVLGGVENSLPDAAKDIGAWLSKVIGNQVAFQAASGENWTLARGNPTRNASVDGGMPLAKLEWEMIPAPALDPPDAKLIRDIRRTLHEESNPAIPSLQPLAVGDQLLFRTARRMYGASISNQGRLIWEGPEDEPFPDADTSSEQARQQALRKRGDLLTRRMCLDAAYGQMSSDGRRLFMITGNKAAATTPVTTRRWGTQTWRTTSTNQLIALELASEGKMLWTSVDEWEQPVFFLGAPLPIEDDLFAIAEIKDEIKLVCMDPANGSIRWSQQLAQVESPFAAQLDITRRLAGATPSFADGIMVCPTSSGVVVAVDIASRTLLWAHAYGLEGVVNKQHMFGSARINYSSGKPGEQWADSTAILDRGLAILTPVETQKLQCVDLLTGKLKWSKPRKKMLFTGGIHDGVLVMVENNVIRGLQADNGTQAWEPVSLGSGTFTSGRGFIADGHYYLPVANNESPPTGAIVQVRIADGKNESQPTERVLGNLICHGDYLVSQGLDGIFGYALRDRKRESVLTAINNNTEDPSILEDYANILASDGERDKAIETMRRACELESDTLDREELQVGLLRMIIGSLQWDFEKHKDKIEEATALATKPEEQTRLDNVVAVGLISIGQYDEALAAHLRLTDSLTALPTDPDEIRRPQPVESNSEWRVSDATSLALRIQEIITKSSDPGAAVKSIKESLTAVRENKPENTPARMAAWLSVFSNLPELDEDCGHLRIEMAKQLLQATPENNQQACDLLALVANSDDKSLAMPATAQLAKAYGYEHPRLATAVLQRAADRWPDDKLVDADGNAERSANELLEQFKDGLPDAPQPWRTTPFRIAREQEVRRSSSYTQIFEVHLKSQSPQWPAGGKVFIKSRPSQIIVVDGHGKTIRTCQTQMLNTQFARYSTARHFGHTLIVSLSDRILAIDMLANTANPLWTYKLTTTDYGRGMSSKPKQVSLPFEQRMRHIAVDGTGAPRGQIGAISQYGVCVIKGTELQCLDLRTGQPRWIVRNAGGKVTIFGDETHCYVGRDATGETRVFEMRTGKEIEKVKIPSDPSNKHWATLGRYILHYDGRYTNGRELRIMLYDCRNEKTVWSQPVGALTRGAIINNEELVLMETTGKLSIRRIIDGELLVEESVNPEKALNGVYAWKSDDQYLVVTNHNDPLILAQRRKNVHVTPPSNGIATQLVSGHLYAFDRETKEKSWEPISIPQYGVPISQPSDSPLFVALRQVTRNPSRSKNTCEVVMIDKRTGKIAAYSGKDRISSGTCQVIADQETQHVAINLSSMQGFLGTFADPDLIDAEDPAPVEWVERLEAVPIKDPDAEETDESEDAESKSAFEKAVEAANKEKAARAKLEAAKKELQKAEALKKQAEEKAKQP